MAKVRDYAAEYARRIERATVQGLTRSQARGHPRVGEANISRKVVLPKYDRRLEEGLKALRGGKSLSKASQSIHVSAERLRRYIQQTEVVEKQGGRWKVGMDNRLREMRLFSDGQTHKITVSGYQEAYAIGRYMAAVGQFLNTNDATVLQEFVGKSVSDVNGDQYVFETNPNTLYRLSQIDEEPYEDVYQIVA